MKKPGTTVVDDLDNPEEGANWRALPRSFTIRRRLKISLDEFAARYRIPIDTLRAWEDGSERPDAVAEAYLLAIARAPEAIAAALVRPERLAGKAAAE